MLKDQATAPKSSHDRAPRCHANRSGGNFTRGIRQRSHRRDAADAITDPISRLAIASGGQSRRSECQERRVQLSYTSIRAPINARPAIWPSPRATWCRRTIPRRWSPSPKRSDLCDLLGSRTGANPDPQVCRARADSKPKWLFPAMNPIRHWASSRSWTIRST